MHARFVCNTSEHYIEGFHSSTQHLNRRLPRGLENALDDEESEGPEDVLNDVEPVSLVDSDDDAPSLCSSDGSMPALV